MPNRRRKGQRQAKPESSARLAKLPAGTLAGQQALAAFVLPPASVEERLALKASIATAGLLVRVVCSAGPACRGEIAGGQTQVGICADLGIDLKQTTEVARLPPRWRKDER